MKAQIKIDNPEELEATISLTMKLKEWEQVEKQLSQEHPSWKIGFAIEQLVKQAKQTFYAEQEHNV